MRTSWLWGYRADLSIPCQNPGRHILSPKSHLIFAFLLLSTHFYNLLSKSSVNNHHQISDILLSAANFISNIYLVSRNHTPETIIHVSNTSKGAGHFTSTSMLLPALLVGGSSCFPCTEVLRLVVRRCMCQSVFLSRCLVRHR